MIDDYDESSGWMFFWYRLTRVFPDKFHRAVKRLCVCVCVSLLLENNPEFSFSLFQTMAEASSKRLVNLASQWEKHRVPLIEQYRTLKDSAAGAVVTVFIILLLLSYYSHYTEHLVLAGIWS